MRTASVLSQGSICMSLAPALMASNNKYFTSTGISIPVSADSDCK
jgi:hypothetical protein